MSTCSLLLSFMHEARSITEIKVSIFPYCAFVVMNSIIFNVLRFDKHSSLPYKFSFYTSSFLNNRIPVLINICEAKPTREVRVQFFLCVKCVFYAVSRDVIVTLCKLQINTIWTEEIKEATCNTWLDYTHSSVCSDVMAYSCKRRTDVTTQS